MTRASPTFRTATVAALIGAAGLSPKGAETG